VACAAFWGLHGSLVNYEGFPVFPGSGEDPYARDLLAGHYANFKADLVITLIDCWVLDPVALQGMNVAHWVPVDTSPLSVQDQKFFAASPGRPVAMSRFGESMLRNAGFSPLFAPHALDMRAWSPLEGRDEARSKLGLDGQFIIGINAANQDPERKAHAEQVKAFAKFAAGHDDARLFIHSRAHTQNGPDLEQMIAAHGLTGKAILADQYAVSAGMILEPGMIGWHGAIDVLSNCAYGEGFGLAVLQSQACGTPVVVNGCSAMTELCGAGWTVRGQEKWHFRHQANWQVPDIGSIARAYEKAWQHARDPQMREKARRFALRYDADTVYEQYWRPVLEELADSPAARRASGRKPRRPQVWDTFMLAGETDTLAMRLAETAGLVHHHVAVQAPVTHRGVAKSVLSADDLRAAGARKGTVTLVTTQLPQHPDPWVLEHAQRDAAWRTLSARAADDDWVLICDADEIPSASLITALETVPVPVVSVRMRTALYAVDWLVPDELTPPTCVAARMGWLRLRALEGKGLAWVRDHRADYLEVGDGGWHFSWIGGPEAQARKLTETTCHTEILGTPEAHLILSGARYRDGTDGGGLPVKPADVDGTWPAWIRDRKCPATWFRPRGEAAS
jgi:Glycosyltransferase family 17